MTSHRKFVAGLGMSVTGAILLAAFISPFFGALDRPVHVVTGNGDPAASQNGVTVEQFDYQEPPSASPDETGKPSGEADMLAPDAAPADPNGAGNNPLADAPEAGNPSSAPQETAPQSAEPQQLTPSEAPAPGAASSMQLLQRPVATAAGQLESNGRTIDLQDISVVPPEETCMAGNGEVWPCGMHARTAFRAWLRSRAIMCELPENDSNANIITHCKLGDDDPAEWLVANGWARAVPGGAYADAGKQAEEGRRGIFGDKPSAALPDMNGTQPMDSGAPSAPEPAQPQLNGAFPPAPAAPQ